MSEADEARKAKSLNSIDHSLRDLVKVLVVMNENFVAFVKKLEDWEIVEIGSNTDEENKNMSDPHSDADKIHDVVADMNILQNEAERETTITQPKDD
jgi:hypothetical protein